MQLGDEAFQATLSDVEGLDKELLQVFFERWKLKQDLTFEDQVDSNQETKSRILFQHDKLPKVCYIMLQNWFSPIFLLLGSFVNLCFHNSFCVSLVCGATPTQGTK